MRRLLPLLLFFALFFFAHGGGVARATIPPAVCIGPGNCLVSWYPGLNTSLYTYLGNSSAPTPPMNLNVYIEFLNDSVTPFTTTQKTIIEELWSHAGSSSWFQGIQSEWPNSGDLGANTSGTLSLTNCPGTHCIDVTYSAGATFLASTACDQFFSNGISDNYGLFIGITSVGNTHGGLFNGSCSHGGHGLIAVPHNIDLATNVDNCLGTSLSQAAAVTTTTANFTQPNVGSTVSVSLAASWSTSQAYIQGGGWYSPTTSGTSITATNLGSPGNASPGTVINSGANVYQFQYPPSPNSANGGCFFDGLIWGMMVEASGSIGDFNGRGWGSTNGAGGEIHEDCLSAGAFDSTFNSPALGVTAPSNFGFTDSSTRFDYLLPAWFHTTQGGSVVGGYCGGHPYANYWSTPCNSNSDCPSVSGHCSGSGYGAHCVAPTCSDGIKNGWETDTDCGGGYCGRCGIGQACGSAYDCQANFPPTWCISGVCATH